MECFGRLIPRLLIVRSTHRGVAFVSGKAPRKIGPGLRWYWPVTTEVELLPVVRQTLNLHTQILLTADHRSVAMSAIVVYRINDILRAVAKTHDVADTIADVAQTAVVTTVANTKMENLTELDLTNDVRSELRRFGVRVEKCAITDWSPCLVIRTIEGV